MPTFIRIITPSSTQDAPYHGESLTDLVQYEPSDGVYTITNTYNTTQVLKITDHFDRLEDSARRANITMTLDRMRIRQTLREMIQEANWGDVRFRVTVGREHPDRFILSIEPFKPLAPEILQDGTRCITAPNAARQNAEAKTTDWAIQRKGLQDAMPVGIYDTFLQDADGFLLEGLASNFYAVLDGVLYTAGAGVLKGISQQIVLAVAPNVLPVKLEAVHVNQLANLSEAFLSSSSRGIVPVVEIDGIAIGDGKVGQFTQQLRQHYSEWMQTHLEEL